MDNKEKYIEMQKLFTRMSHEIMCNVVASFYIWRTLRFSKSSAEAGQEEAEENTRIMNIHKDFFIPTEHSHLSTFVIGLSKFFDRGDQPLSLANLIAQIEQNKHHFTVETFREVHPHLTELGLVKEEYSPIKENISDDLLRLRTKHSSLISSLKDLRDTQFAHTDITPKTGITFIPNEVEALIKDIQNFFNKLSGSFDDSSTTWDHWETDSISSAAFLIDELRKRETHRKKEFEEKWRGKMD